MVSRNSATHSHIDTMMNASNECIGQDRAQENKWGKRDAFDKQRETQTVVRTPQRDPKSVEFVPLRQQVNCEVRPPGMRSRSAKT